MRVTSHNDRCRFPSTVWRAIRNAGLEPSAILRAAGLPATIHLDASACLSTAQLFSIWKAVEVLSKDETFALRVIAGADGAGHQPAFITALYASDFRDGIHRLLRFKRVASIERFWTHEEDGMWMLGRDWPFATEPEPATSVDLAFASLVELGRRGTRQHLVPLRVEFIRDHPRSEGLERYFGCSIEYGAERNTIVFASCDLDILFPGYSPEFLELVAPGLQSALEEIKVGATITERIKTICSILRTCRIN